MSSDSIKERFDRSPVIFSAKNDEALDLGLQSDHEVIFLLYGDLCNLAAIVSRIKERDKIAIVHLDLVDGLVSREIAADFVRQYTEADGIISTRPKLLKRGKELGLFTILRIFLLDSMALENVARNVQICEPDMIEILPGIVSKLFPVIRKRHNLPIIAGGFIKKEEDVLDAFLHGASAISSSTLSLGHLNRLRREGDALQQESVKSNF